MHRRSSRALFNVVTVIAIASFGPALAGDHGGGGGKKHQDTKWVASWTTAPQDSWKGFNGDALVNFAFPFTPATATTPASSPPVARNQTLRMIVKPDIWGDTFRVRLTNTWGSSPLTFGRVTIGLQSFSGATVAGTNTEVRFHGRSFVTVPAGAETWSDPVKVSWGAAPRHARAVPLVPASGRGGSLPEDRSVADGLKIFTFTGERSAPRPLSGASRGSYPSAVRRREFQARP